MACGSGGDACVACPNGDVCNNAQVCVVDPVSQWRVRPTSATAATTLNGASWDTGGGAPDLYVELMCPRTASAVTASTAVVDDSFTPTWANTTGSCIMTAADLQAIGVRLRVLDEDIAADDLAIDINITFTEAQLRAGTTTRSSGSITQITLQLTRQ